jgi:hypothetical protein
MDSLGVPALSSAVKSAALGRAPQGRLRPISVSRCAPGALARAYWSRNSMPSRVRAYWSQNSHRRFDGRFGIQVSRCPREHTRDSAANRPCQVIDLYHGGHSARERHSRKNRRAAEPTFCATRPPEETPPSSQKMVRAGQTSLQQICRSEPSAIFDWGLRPPRGEITFDRRNVPRPHRNIYRNLCRFADRRKAVRGLVFPGDFPVATGQWKSGAPAD